MPRVPTAEAQKPLPLTVLDAELQAKAGQAVGEGLSELGRGIAALGGKMEEARQEQAKVDAKTRLAEKLPEIERAAAAADPDQHAEVYQREFDAAAGEIIDNSDWRDRRGLGLEFQQIRASEIASQKRIGTQRIIDRGKNTIQNETAPAFRRAISEAPNALLKRQLEDSFNDLVRSSSYFTEAEKSDLESNFGRSVTEDRLESALTNNPAALRVALEDPDFAIKLTPAEREVYKRKAEDEEYQIGARERAAVNQARADATHFRTERARTLMQGAEKRYADTLAGVPGATLMTEAEVSGLVNSGVLSRQDIKRLHQMTKLEDQKSEGLVLYEANKVAENSQLDPDVRARTINEMRGLTPTDRNKLLEKIASTTEDPSIGAMTKAVFTTVNSSTQTSFMGSFTSPLQRRELANAAENEAFARAQRLQKQNKLTPDAIEQIRNDVIRQYTTAMEDVGSTPALLPSGFTEAPASLDEVRERMRWIDESRDESGVARRDVSGEDMRKLRTWEAHFVQQIRSVSRPKAPSAGSSATAGAPAGGEAP